MYIKSSNNIETCLFSEQVNLYMSLTKDLPLVLAFNFRICSMELFVLQVTFRLAYLNNLLKHLVSLPV
jgi:hypothetical protein